MNLIWHRRSTTSELGFNGLNCSVVGEGADCATCLKLPWQLEDTEQNSTDFATHSSLSGTILPSYKSLILQDT